MNFPHKIHLLKCHNNTKITHRGHLSKPHSKLKSKLELHSKNCAVFKKFTFIIIIKLIIAFATNYSIPVFAALQACSLAMIAVMGLMN